MVDKFEGFRNYADQVAQVHEKETKNRLKNFISAFNKKVKEDDLKLIVKVREFLEERFISCGYFDSYDVSLDSDHNIRIRLDYVRGGREFNKDVVLSLIELRYIRSECLEKFLEVNIL